MPRPTKNNRSKKQESGSRTSWKKPDGTPLRKRRGDYFPDEEIAKRSNPKKRFSDEGRATDETESRKKFDRTDRDANRSDTGKRFGNDDRSKSSYNKSKSRSSDREEKRPFRERRFGSSDETRKTNKGRTSYGDRSEVREPSNERPTYGDRSESREPIKDRPTYGDRSKKPFEKRGESKREGSYERSASRPSRHGEKPSWKKRERYDRIEHSENMGSRFEKGSRYKKRDQTKRKDRPASTKTFQPDADGAIRLNRFIANAGICSRREADDLIEAGVISINGKVVTELGTKVIPGDEVRFHDRVLRTERMVYVLLNKPKDYITTTDDPDDRKTVMNLVHDACKERIFPVGRLDRNTTGLLLLTNDGDLTKKLTHPSSNIAKVYQVELDKNLTIADMKTASEGVELEDGVVAFDNIEYASPDDKKIVGVELHSGKNRIVRRIFEELGYEVKKLDRTIFAGLTKKDLPRGRWRFLTELEVSGLKMLKGGSGRSGKR